MPSGLPALSEDGRMAGSSSLHRSETGLTAGSEQPAHGSGGQGADSSQLPDPRLLEIAGTVGMGSLFHKTKSGRQVQGPAPVPMYPQMGEERAIDVEHMMMTYGMTQAEKPDEMTWLPTEKLHELSSNAYNISGCRALCARVSGSIQFQAAIGVLILLNAAIVGFEVDADNQQEDVFHTIEMVFTVLFLTEVAIRLAGCSPEKPFRSDYWLMFDMAIVFTSLVDNFVLHFIADDSNDGEGIVDLSLVMLLRLLRVLRILRLFRAIRIFRPVRILMAACVREAQTLFWTLVLLFVLFYCFGLTFRMLFERARKTETIERILDRYFASIWDCLLTEFEVLLGGFNWYTEITYPLLQSGDSIMLSVVWISFLCVIHLCVANVITGIFVEQLLAAAKENDEALSKELFVKRSANLSELKELFEDIDTHGRGFITLEEFTEAVRTHDQLAVTLGIEEREEAEVFFNALDLHARGIVRPEDFIFGIIKLKGGTKSIDMLSFDYQVKQIIRLVQKSPQRIDELHTRLARFETSLDQLWKDLEATGNTASNELPAMGERLGRLEAQIDTFMAGIVASDRSQLGAPPVTAAPAAPSTSSSSSRQAISLANLRESYALADEMRELRQVLLMTAGAANAAQRTALPAQLPPAESTANTLESQMESRESTSDSRSAASGPAAGGSPPLKSALARHQAARERSRDVSLEVAQIQRQGGLADSSPKSVSSVADGQSQPVPRERQMQKAEQGRSAGASPSASPAPSPGQTADTGQTGISETMQRLEQAIGGLLPRTALRNSLNR